MTHSLVTFLGRVATDQGGVYRTATYAFEDGSREATSFFGLALTRHLWPDRLVVLGTSGSMWSALVEHAAGEGEEEARLELIDAERDGVVDQTLLDRLSGILAHATGREVVPKLIPFGRTDAEQRAILETVGAAVPSGAVSFDLTHGFRHLGMLGLLSAFMLARIGRLAVRSLWYGALDMTREDGVTPVLRLDGLGAIERWVGALDRFDASGDYGVFAPLLIADDVPPAKARCLEEAAFYERTFNLGDAVRKLRTFRTALQDPLPGASGLFQQRLAERLRWIEHPDLSAQQRELAGQYLGRGDFVRAAIFGYEAIVSRECKGYELHRRETREAAEQALDAKFKSDRDSPSGKAYWTIRYLRNALAHGTPPENERVHALLKSPERLRPALQVAIRCLLA